MLIDPPYEAEGELERAARALGPALKRFGHGLYLWWRPMKSQGALDAADAEVRVQGAKAVLRADLWVDTPKPVGRLAGSSLLLLNPPFGLREALEQTLPQLSSRLALGAAGWRLQ